MWINRDISGFLEGNHDTIQVLRGPRQCGKTSLALRLDSEFVEVSLDDPHNRTLAQSDPVQFLSRFGQKKLFIDEAQYAPGLFPLLKLRADQYKRTQKKILETQIRITGSNQILMDQQVKESLAGRASFFDMNTLSVAEIRNCFAIPICEILFKGGWPELYVYQDKSPSKYLDDYINSYVEKDIILSAGIQKQREFLRFLKLVAGRTAQIVDYHSLGVDTGVDSKTVKDWLSILERMRVISLVSPYHSNLSKRLIKSPKLYFYDTGLACRLQGWSSLDPLMISPQFGALFENLVFSEIKKTFLNFGLGGEIFFWRTRDGEEVDFVLQMPDSKWVMIEAKTAFQQPPGLDSFSELKKVFRNQSVNFFVCHLEGEDILGKCVPVAKLRDVLLERA